MSVRVADAIEPMNDLTTFPVAYGKDVWLDKNKGVAPANYKNLQAMYNDDELGSGGGSTIQVDSMPAASADELGKIYQYVGENGTYKKGYLYECVYVPMELATSPYKWMEVDHFRFNHVIYNSNTPPTNSDYTVGDIVFYTGKTMDDFTSGHYYRALPTDTPQSKYTFILGSTVYFSYTPFEFRLGFIIYPTGTGGENHPYKITEISEEGITATPYGWTGEDQLFETVYYRTEILSWEDLGGGGGGSIFYGTMDEWDALTTDQKKQYDYMADNNTGGDDVISIPNPMTRNTVRTSDLQEIGALKQGRIAQIKCYVVFKDILSSTWNTVATVDDSLKPAMETPLIVSEGAVVNKVALFRLATDGKIQVWGNQIANGDTTRISATYFTAS